MEVNPKINLSQKLKSLFLKEPKPFSTKQDFNWKLTGTVLGIGLVVSIFVLLLLPQPIPQNSEFHETVAGDVSKKNGDRPSEADAWASLQNRGGFNANDFLGLPRTTTTSTKNHNSPMVLIRTGYDSRTQLPAGTRIQIRLTQRVVVQSSAMPIIGVVTNDVLQESTIAIPRDTQIFGTVSFDDTSERALINWTSVTFPDGRQRELLALALGVDEQAGVNGNVKSEALKNIIGATVSRFIGAYAEGSMTRNQMGFSQGGNNNGFKNAIAETAKDRAEDWADSLKRTRKWIEVNEGTNLIAVLKQTFTFRDPGAVH